MGSLEGLDLRFEELTSHGESFAGGNLPLRDIVVDSGNFLHEANNCTNVTMRRVTCLAGSDGIHLHCSRNILIEECLFKTGDDCIAGININGLHVRNCVMNTSCNLFRMGGVHILVEVGTSNFVSLPRWVILGTNGTAVIEDWNLNGREVCAKGNDEKDVVPVITAAGLTKTMAPRREDTIATYPLPIVHSDVRDFYRNVIAHLDGKADRLIKLPEVARVMRLMEAIRESAANRQVVYLEKE